MGCESVARRPIGPCPKDLPTVALDQFLANPEAHPLPVTLAGILVPGGSRCSRGYFMAYPAGSCPLSCRAILVLVPEAKIAANPQPARDLRITGDAWDYGPGVAVLPTNADPFLCRGDDSAVCCQVPIDGRRVAVTFDRARTGPREWPNNIGDRDDLTSSAMCVLGP
jgi:hypothetical protein